MNFKNIMLGLSAGGSLAVLSSALISYYRKRSVFSVRKFRTCHTFFDVCCTHPSHSSDVSDPVKCNGLLTHSSMIGRNESIAYNQGCNLVINAHVRNHPTHRSFMSCHYRYSQCFSPDDHKQHLFTDDRFHTHSEDVAYTATNGVAEERSKERESGNDTAPMNGMT